MTETNGQSRETPNSRGIRPDDVLMGFDPAGDLARSNTLREVASNLATDTNMAVGEALNTAQAAADAAVKTSGDQTIDDVKTFTSILVLPDANPTSPNDAARKKYVDETVAAVQGLTEWDAGLVYTHPVIVTGSDGNSYVSVRDSTGVDPATDSDESHWKRFGTSAPATEAVAGIVELATQQEADAGTDTQRAMTPALVARVAVPTGMIMAFGGSSAPTGYLACDGAAVSRSTYDTLFGVIGTTYGAGDGSATFNLPNFRGRFGIGSSGTRPLGRTGGQENVTLTRGQLPSHSHGDGTLRTTSAGSHSHSSGSYSATSAGSHIHGPGTYATDEVGDHKHPFAAYSNGGSGLARGHAGNPIVGYQTTKGGGRHSHDVTGTSAAGGSHTHGVSGNSGSAGSHSHDVSGATGSAGGGQSHDNMPPYLSVTYIIKT